MTADAPRKGRLRWRAGAAAAMVLSAMILVPQQASMPIAFTGMGMALASLADPLRIGIPRTRLLATFGAIGAALAIVGSLVSGAKLASVGLLTAVVWSSSMALRVHPTWTWVLYLSVVWLIGVLNLPGGPPRQGFVVGGLFLLGVALYALGTLLFPGPELPRHTPSPPSPQVAHRFALVRTAAVTTSAFVGWPLVPEHPFWAAAATHFVIRPTWKQQPGAAFWRATGTALGAMVGILFALAWPDTPVMTVSLWLSGTAIFLMGHLHGGVMMFWVTLCLMSMLSVAGADILQLGPERILTDTIGLLIGLFADGLLRHWLRDDVPPIATR